MVQRLGGCSVLWFVAVVATSTGSEPLQSAGHANHIGSIRPSASSLVGDTMSSTNGVPFDWSSDYEMAVVYITSAWTEFGDVRSSDAPLGIIAENGFLNYCVRFKTKLAAWAKSLQDRPDVSETVKKAVSSWYRAIDTLSRDNWNLPVALTLESFRKQFMTAYKHLVLNGAEIYEKSDTETVKRDVDGFTRDVADMMIGTLKEISVKSQWTIVYATCLRGRPGTEPEWAAPIFEEFKTMAGNITNLVGLDNTAEYTTAAKNNLNAFADSLKSEATAFSKSFEGKSSVSDLFKESTKQFQTVVDTYVKNLPKDLTMKDFTEKSEQALKYLVEHGTEITKKAQGNTEIEKQIKEFIKKNIESLMEQTKAIQAKLAEVKKAWSRIVRKYPVLVFIHGESYEWNSGNPYDGRVLASNAELVVVTLNYRLGILGFLNANGSPNSRARVANYGLMDQIAVLHWVQQNIALFGGDPENVSLMGHGPGAACINFLMISPTVVPGLFRRAILLSGSALSSWALVEDPVSYALDLAKQVNCTTDGTGNNPEPIVDCLREVPLDLLMSAGVALPTYLSAFGPSVDGVVVKSNYQEDVITNLLPEFDGYSGSSVAFGARKFQKFEFGSGINKYDLLFGVVTSEALWRFSSNDIQAGFEGDRRDKILRTYVRNAYSYHLSEIFFTIVNEYTDWERTVLHPINTRDATISALSDAQYVAPLVHTGDMLSQPKTPAADDLNKDRRTKSFFYVFDYQTRDGDYPQRIGTAHGEELPYMFGAPMVTDGMNHFSRNFTKAEALLSDAMILYLGNFARTGDPNDHDDKPDSGSKERNRFRSVTWDEYDPVHQKYLEISMKPRMKNHFRAHQLSVWLRLIPELHRAGMEDVMLRHNLFRNHDDAELYEGVVRPDPLSRRAPQRATVNRFTANGTVAEVVQSLTTTGRPQWPVVEATTCVPPARGSNAANASTSAEDALATLGAAGYAAYSTALHVTIALGVSLLVLNGLLLVIICYQKDRFKCLQHHQQHQHQQTVGGQEDSVRYKAATVPDDRLQQSAAVVVDKAGGYDGRHHHMHHHPPSQQMHLAADAVAVDMEQRHHHHHGAGGHHQHHHMHHHHVPTAAGGQQHPPPPQTTATMTTTTQQQQLSAATAAVRAAAGHDMTFPKAAKPSSRLLHDHQVGGGCPPNGSLVHGTLPKPPPPPRSSVGVQSQESQPLLVQQGVGIGQMPKTGTLKMPVAAMSEMRV